MSSPTRRIGIRVVAGIGTSSVELRKMSLSEMLRNEGPLTNPPFNLPHKASHIWRVFFLVRLQSAV